MTRKPEGGDGADPGPLVPAGASGVSVVEAERERAPAKVHLEGSLTVGDNELMFEVDGPGVHPHNIDTLGALRMAFSFFSLVAIEAERAGTRLQFGGLMIRDKCAAIACAVNDSVAGRQAIERALIVLRGEAPAPHRAKTHAINFLRASELFGGEHTFRARAGKEWSSAIDIPRRRGILPPADEGGVIFAGPDEEHESWVSLRARPIRAGGKRPEVLFDSVMEREDFALATTEERARELGSMLYREIELEAIVRRRRGVIVGGEIQRFRPVSDDSGDPWTPWVEWYQTVSRE